MADTLTFGTEDPDTNLFKLFRSHFSSLVLKFVLRILVNQVGRTKKRNVLSCFNDLVN